MHAAYLSNKSEAWKSAAALWTRPAIATFNLQAYSPITCETPKPIAYEHLIVTKTTCVLSCSAVSDFLLAHGLYPARLLCPWHFSGKNTGVGCQLLLQGIFPTQELNPGLPLCRQILYQLSYYLSLQQIYSFYWCWVFPRCWRLPAAQGGGCWRMGWLWQFLKIGEDCKFAASPDSSFHEQSLCMQCCLAAFCPRQKFFQNWSWSPQTLLLLSQISLIL